MKAIERKPNTSFRLRANKVTAIMDAIWASEEVTTTLTGAAQAGKARTMAREALTNLVGVHDKKMAGRVAHFQSTCRFDGCSKQPRKTRGNPKAQGTKGRRGQQFLCRGHVAILGRIPSELERQLLGNRNLRVVA